MRRPHPAALGLLFLWGAAVAVVAVLAGRFWIPLDDGTLAQSAERVLLGQLPHRDFGDPYSGLNAVLGAVAFKVLGVRLMSLRIPLVVGFALWLPTVWSLARGMVGPRAALVATTLAGTLSVLAYPAAMPTWYGLFLATWGCWLLIRWSDAPRRGLLLAVGAVAGVATLFKVVGLYLLAAALLGVAWRRSDGTRAFATVATLSVAAFLVVLAVLVLPRSSAVGAYHFLLPAAALCGGLVARAWTIRDADAVGGGGLGALVGDGAVLWVGALLPVAIFLVPYASSGAVGAWAEGVFLLPGRRFQAAASPPGPLWTVVPGLAAVVLAGVAVRLSREGERRLATAVAAALALALALDDRFGGAVMSALWYSARGWIPALAILCAMRQRRLDGAGFLLLVTAGLWALVQFPYAAPAYFFYVAPLGVLATLGAVRAGILRAGPLLGLMASVYLFLGAGYVTGVAASANHPLQAPRGDILVPAADAAVYDALVSAVSDHLGAGALWAGPDAPEVYFLAEAPNPTPTLYEFLDTSPFSAQDMEALASDHGVSVVVVNTRPLFSPPLDPETLETLVSTFPESRSAGPFIVRWRSP